MPAANAPEPPDPAPRSDLEAVPAFLRARAAAIRASFRPDDGTNAPDRRAPLSDRVPIDPGALPIARIPSRHLARAVGLVLVAWVALMLARQVGDAAASTSRVDAMRASNAALRSELGALQGELATISDKRYVDLEARAHGLGTPGEIPFALQMNTPSLPPDAPGSASVRLGAVDAHRSPLESWLSILFGDGG